LTLHGWQIIAGQNIVGQYRMVRLLRKLSGGVAGEASISLLFFALYYLYLWLVVDLRLIYHGGGIILNFPVFYRGWEFFQGFLSYPGGPADYVSAFLAQFFYIGWAGALVATVQAWLLWFCTGSIMRAVNGWRPRWVCFILPIFLLVLYTQSLYQFTTAMTLLAAFGLVCLYVRTASKSKPVSLLVFLALSTVVYAIAGKGYLLFAALCAIYELLVRRRWPMSVVYLAAALIVSYIEDLLIFDASVVASLSRFRPLPLEAGPGMMMVIYILYLFLPVTVLGLWLLGFFGVSPSGRFFYRGTGMIPRVIGLAFPFVVGVAAVGLSYNSTLKTMLEIDYYGCQKMWPEVLQAANRPPRYKFASHVVNRALCHTGRLADDMFSYPQRAEVLFIAHNIDNTAFWELSDTFIDLGQINMAEYAFFACVETYGERPIILRRLALVNMVKGNIGAARVCLGTLSKTLFDASWARDCLERIEADPNLSKDKEVQYLRGLMAEKNRNTLAIEPNMLLDLLDKNKGNRMAFEYLMGYYLLKGQFDAFVGNLYRLNDFDYARIPRAYEEAILYYNYTKKTKAELPPGREISPESRERFNNFVKIYLERYRGNKNAAYNELARDYGDSYFFYCIYRQSGMKK
jgi:hypothetical protein